MAMAADGEARAAATMALMVSLLLVVVLLLLLVPYYFATSSIRSVWFGFSRGHVDGRLLPPSPPKLPVIGHLHLIESDDPTGSLAELDRRHGAGGLMILYLGQVRNLVVSSPRAAEAVLRKHDQIFSSRPLSAVGDVLFSRGSMLDVGLAPYGEHWRHVRKLVTTDLLSATKVRSLRCAREEEARGVVARIRDAAAVRSAAAVDLSALLSSFANGIVCRVVSGKFFRDGGRNKLLTELIEATMAVSGGLNIDDHFPSLAKIGVLTRVLLGKISKVRRRWDDLLDEIIDEHARKSSSSRLHHQDRDQTQHQEQNADEDHDQAQDRDDDHQDRDLVDILLSLQDEYSLGRDQIKAILVDMFLAGTGTSYRVLEHAMAELIRKPQLMAKLQEEVRKKTRRRRRQCAVEEEDLSCMTYLNAVVKETLRLHPPVPLLALGVAVANCNDMDGYMIPAGTRVVVNVLALGTDAATWGDDADEFTPERFVETDHGGAMALAAVDFKGTDYSFLPFGGGRRMCPGMNFGLASVAVMLANLVYCFDWELPAAMFRREDIDMATTVHQKKKLSLVPIIRQVDHA